MLCFQLSTHPSPLSRLTLALLGIVLLSMIPLRQSWSADRLGLGAQTLGGRLVWSDEVIFHDWRIQKHALTGHYRLIDGSDQRHVFGSFETCLEKLHEIKDAKQLSPMPDEVVLVLHGLGASRQLMGPLAEMLENKGKLSVVNVGYPSTMGSIDEHALTLASVIEHLDGPSQISFVAHSMGNLVIRHYLNDLRLLTPMARPKIKFKRLVMIAPPNHGAVLADRFADKRLVQMIAGKPLEQLAPHGNWKELEQRLATPDFEFGIIVGGQGDDEGYLPILPGDDDGLLTLETTKLAGASDFAQVRGVHQLLPHNELVQECTLRFLKFGYFVSAEAINPIPR
jgi:pimeloyl-ACP methyl ester carboxylesterase